MAEAPRKLKRGCLLRTGWAADLHQTENRDRFSWDLQGAATDRSLIDFLDLPSTAKCFVDCGGLIKREKSAESRCISQVDTASWITEVTCSGCKVCGQHSHQHFDITRSGLQKNTWKAFWRGAAALPGCHAAPAVPVLAARRSAASKRSISKGRLSKGLSLSLLSRKEGLNLKACLCF